MKLILNILLIFLVIQSYGQEKTKTFSFPNGEKITYDVRYSIGFFWFTAGFVTFNVDSIEYLNQPAYHFVSIGSSYPGYDWIFKVRDRYESITTADDIKSIYYTRKTFEGGYQVDNTYTFDYDKKVINYRINNSTIDEKKGTTTWNNQIRDVLASAYYLRSINFTGLTPNTKIPLNTILDGEYFPLYVRYLGKIKIENIDGQIYDCFKFTAKVVGGTIFKEGENLEVWVTNDSRKIPIKIQAEILVGQIKVYMTNYQISKSIIKN